MISFVFTVTTMKTHLEQTSDRQKSVFSVISGGVDMENSAVALMIYSHMEALGHVTLSWIPYGSPRSSVKVQ